MRTFLIGLVVAATLALAGGLAYGLFEISAGEYFSTPATRL